MRQRRLVQAADETSEEDDATALDHIAGNVTDVALARRPFVTGMAAIAAAICAAICAAFPTSSHVAFLTSVLGAVLADRLATIILAAKLAKQRLLS